MEFSVNSNGKLLEFLFENVKGSRTTIKSYLRNRQVSINSVPTTQFDAPVSIGDVVRIDTSQQKPVLTSKLLTLLYEDEYVVVISKREGLLSIATDKQKSRTAYNIVSDYLKQFDPSARIFIVHRLDRETSGVMMFAKSQNIQHALQYNWEDRVLERKYYAVVEGLVENDEDTIETYLFETKALKVIATDDSQGRKAKTTYKVIQRSAHYSLLELKLQTGRKNQIRAHMNYIGHPVVGDAKYGAKTNPIRRVALHAASVTMLHPVSEQQISFSTNIPRSFMMLMENDSKKRPSVSNPDR